MAPALKNHRGPLAAVSATLLVSAAVVVLSATMIGERLVAMQQATAAAAPAPQADVLTVDRTNKGDKLAAPDNEQARSEIKSVEVIGLSNASIVYRDRDGNVLYRTDPLANVTVVTKNVDLPEVTIRETGASEIQRLPVEEASPAVKPHGCESAFARPSPESLTRQSSRCLTSTGDAREYAALQ